MEGDIILGGLFPVHLKSDETENTCGVFDEIAGYQFIEGMLFAIKQVNADPKLLPNITLGARIHDSCQSKTIAANAAKEFIKMTLVKDTKAQLAGVVGASGSEVTETVANFLRVFEIPQISYDSTSVSLSNKDIYSYFLRTVPPDSFQAQTIVDLCKKFGWNYVSTVNVYGAYGTKGMEEFWRASKRNGK
jgi:ABC-type branched-subunit amino acid transport system substrate-binding protein